jgi:hypothetical protein
VHTDLSFLSNRDKPKQEETSKSPLVQAERETREERKEKKSLDRYIVKRFATEEQRKNMQSGIHISSD